MVVGSGLADTGPWVHILTLSGLGRAMSREGTITSTIPVTGGNRHFFGGGKVGEIDMAITLLLEACSSVLSIKTRLFFGICILAATAKFVRNEIA